MATENTETGQESFGGSSSLKACLLFVFSVHSCGPSFAHVSHPRSDEQKNQNKSIPPVFFASSCLGALRDCFFAHRLGISSLNRCRVGNQASEATSRDFCFCHGQRDESRRFVGWMKTSGGRAGGKALTRRAAQPGDRRRKTHGFFVGFPRCQCCRESCPSARGRTKPQRFWWVASRRLRRPAPWTQSTAHRNEITDRGKTVRRVCESAVLCAGFFDNRGRGVIVPS